MGSGVSESRRLLRARDTMDRRFAEPLDVADLAAIALMSEAHFSRRFKRLFGEPPHEYLYRRRIGRAKWLLRTTDLPVTEISRIVGYSSLGTFTRTFSRIVGETPIEHRARGPIGPILGCFVRTWNGDSRGLSEDSRFGEAGG